MDRGGHAIEQARAVPQLATAWAVAVDQSDPRIARMFRHALKRRQKAIRTTTLKRLSPALEGQLELEGERAGPKQAAVA